MLPEIDSSESLRELYNFTKIVNILMIYSVAIGYLDES